MRSDKVTNRRLVGIDAWQGRVDVWALEPLTAGKPYDSASGDPLFEEALRPLVERLERLVEGGHVSRFAIMANRVTVYTDLPWQEIDASLMSAVADFLGWGALDRKSKRLQA